MSSFIKLLCFWPFTDSLYIYLFGNNHKKNVDSVDGCIIFNIKIFIVYFEFSTTTGDGANFLMCFVSHYLLSNRCHYLVNHATDFS